MCRRSARRVASAQIAVCARDFVRSDRVPRASDPWRPRLRHRLGATGCAWIWDAAADGRRRCSRTSCQLARGARSVGAMGLSRPRRARFAGVRVTPAHGWRQGTLAPVVWLLCEREEGRGGRRQVLLRPLARRGVDARAGAVGASALGDRTAVSRAQERARVGSLRRADVPGVAAPRRARPQSPMRTFSASACAVAPPV